MIEVDVSMPRLFAEGPGTLHLQLTLLPGTLTALVGPSGAGKTTLLRLLAGLDTPRQGRITVDGIPWLNTQARLSLTPQKRSIGYVFQDTALFPNLTVRENIGYAALPTQRSFVDELIRTTGLAAFTDKKPTALSGGQRQRVALARALVRRPAVLLLDEPFAALDAPAGQSLREVLQQLRRTWQTTTLLVSHYDADVRALADRVIELAQGKIVNDQLLAAYRPAPPGERIRRIYFDDVTRQWTIETSTFTLHSGDDSWRLAKAGDTVRVDWSARDQTRE